MVSSRVGDKQVLPDLSLSPHGISSSRAYPCGMGFSQPAGLRVVVLFQWRLISKRKEVGAPSQCYLWNRYHIASLPGYLLVKAVKEPTQIRDGWKVDPIYWWGSNRVTLQKSAWGGRYYCSHLWRLQYTPSEEAISVVQSREDGGLDLPVCTDHEEGVDSEYLSRIYENCKALTNASEYLFNWLVLYKVMWMSVAHHQ